MDIVSQLLSFGRKMDSHVPLSLSDILDTYSHIETNDNLRRVFVDIYNMSIAKGIGKYMANYILGDKNKLSLFYFADFRGKNLDPFILNQVWSSDPITMKLGEMSIKEGAHGDYTILNDNVGMSITMCISKEHSLIDPTTLQFYPSVYTYHNNDIIGTNTFLNECDLGDVDFVNRFSDFMFDRFTFMLNRRYNERTMNTIYTLPIFDIRGGEIHRV